MPKSHRLRQTEWITDGQNEFADLKLIGIGPGHGRKTAGVNFQYGHIGLGVRPDQLGLKFPLVGQEHLDFIRLVHDVVVRDDQPTGIDDDARPQAPFFAFLGASNRFIHSSPKKRRKNGSSKGVPCVPLSRSIPCRENIHDGGLDRFRNIDETLRTRIPARGLNRSGNRSDDRNRTGSGSGTACPVGNQPRLRHSQ